MRIKVTTGIFFLAAILFAGATLAQSIDDGKKFMYYERFKSAKDVFEKLIGVNPNNEEAVYYLGQAEIGLENIPAAKSLYQARLAAFPNSPLVLAGMGHVELLEGKKQDARNRFETAISLSQGKSIAVLNAVGYANASPESKNGDAAYAIEKLKLATQIKKFKDPEVYINLGDAYRKFADGGNAVLSYQAALALDPNYARALYRTGKVYQTQGVSQEPIYLKYFQDALAKDPNYGPVYENYYVYYYESNVSKSAEYLEKWLQNADDDSKACNYRASMKYAQGFFDQAVLKSDECIAAQGNNPYINLYKIKAFAYNRLNDTINAKSSFEEYFKRQNPDKIQSGDYSAYAALLLRFPGNETMAGELVNKAVELDSIEINKVNYLKLLAQSYEVQKKYKEAGEWYNKVLYVKKNHNNLDLYNAGYSFYRVGQFDSAIKIFVKYADKYPNDAFGHYMLAQTHSIIDSTSEKGLAAPYYKKVLEIAEADITKPQSKARALTAYRYFIGYEYNINKDQAAALVYVEKALILEPTDQQLLNFKSVISKNDPKKPSIQPKPKAGSAPIK
ncbi:MAG: tetratricopeptide repeat protein [Ferruginibacter sp.]